MDIKTTHQIGDVLFYPVIEQKTCGTCNGTERVDAIFNGKTVKALCPDCPPVADATHIIFFEFPIRRIDVVITAGKVVEHYFTKEDGSGERLSSDSEQWKYRSTTFNECFSLTNDWFKKKTGREYTSKIVVRF